MIQLTDSIIAIEVPSNQIEDNYEIINGQDDYTIKYLHYPSDVYQGIYQNYDSYELGKGNYTLIGVTPLSYETWCSEIFLFDDNKNKIIYANDLDLILKEKGFNKDYKYVIIKKS